MRTERRIPHWLVSFSLGLIAVQFEKLYKPAEMRDYSLEELVVVLEALPAATTDASGKGLGDPIREKVYLA